MSRRLRPAWAGCYRDARVLVLGAAGFIGRWVARSLCALGARPILVVRDERAARTIFAAYGVDGDVVVADLGEHGSVRRLIESLRPSATFNLAGYGVDPDEKDAGLAERVNVELVGEACDALRRHADSKWAGAALVHAGSMAEYGPIGGTLVEDRVCAPATPYGKSKLAGTALLSECCGKWGVNAVTARIFWAYGPGEHRGRLLPSLIAAAQAHRPVALTAGDQSGDFIYVADVAEGLLRLGVCGGTGEAVNLATGKLTTVREVAEIAAGLLGIAADELRFGDLPQRGDAATGDAAVDVDRLRNRLNWIPTTDVAGGIARTLEFLREGEGGGC